MWFAFSLICLIFWSGSDLFSKIGCNDKDDHLSHLKMVIAVGIVMGLHCAYEVLIAGTVLNLQVVLTYLPVSMLYIVSMAIGYLGLKYIELSISSPICNSSGALVAAMILITKGRSAVNNVQLFATVLVCVGVVGIGVIEAMEDDDLRMKRQMAGNHIYAKSVLAIALPILYSLLDAMGTFADALVLETLDENSANAAYELTFFIVGMLCLIYVLFIRHEKLEVRQEVPKYIGAICETAGQFAYIFAMGDSAHVMLSVSIISAYCVVSMLWSRIFLKEHLSWKHYAAILLVVVGIVIIGAYDA